MLVLTRKRGQSIVIQDGNIKIEVKLLEVDGNRICLGFKAPKEVRIRRSEIPDILDDYRPPKRGV